MKTLLVTQIRNSLYVHDAPADEIGPWTDKNVYKVEKLTNAVEPEIFTEITKAELLVFCDDPDWNVTIK
jgi:hypothetical protein